MPNAILSQHNLTLVEATKLFPSKPHINSLRRWSRKGLCGVKLRTFRSGRRICTSREAVEEFISKVSGQFDGSDQQPVSGSHQAAERELDSMGVR